MNDSDRKFWNEAYNEYPEQVMVVDRILGKEVLDLPVGRRLTWVVVVETMPWP